MNLRQKVNCFLFTILVLAVILLAAGLVFPADASYRAGEGIAPLLKDFLPAFAVCVASISLGVLFILLSELVVRRAKNRRTLTYLSLFAILVCVWILTANPLLGMYFEESYLLTAAAHISLPWAMGFLVLYLFRSKEEAYPIWKTALFLLPFIYGILSVALDAGGVVAFALTSPPLQLLALAIGIDIVVRSVLQFVQIGFSPKESASVLACNDLMLLFAAVTDAVRVLVFHAQDNSRGFRLALLVFMLVMGIDAIMIYADEQNLIEGAGVIKSMAVHDGLTGVYNRMAFNSKLETLPLTENIGFIHFDVNNLKEANDNYGHAEGDALIKSIAHGIEKAFADMGETYRYGGDEFTVITDCFDEDRIKDCLGNLRIYLALMNREDVVHVRMSMACGYDHFCKGDESIFKAFERADERMYENKRGMKELEERLGRM